MVVRLRNDKNRPVTVLVDNLKEKASEDILIVTCNCCTLSCVIKCCNVDNRELSTCLDYVWSCY